MMDRAPAIIVPGVSNIPKRPPRVAIAVPSTDHVHANFTMALSAMLYGLGIRRVPVAIVNAKGSLVQKNRNNAVAQASQYECDWILFLDSDMSFPPTTLERLMAHEKDIVGATYARRTSPHQNLAKPKDGARAVVDGLAEVDALPTGCLLIRMSVFDAMKKPYFRCGFVEEGERWNGIPGPEITGEDYNFCYAAKAAGIGIWMDTQLSFEMIHWGEIGVRLTGSETADAADAQPYELIELPG